MTPDTLPRVIGRASSRWWCWHCMKLVPAGSIALIEDSGGCTGYCKKHPYRELPKEEPK